MSSSDRPQHPQVRPAYPKQPEGTLDEQRALNLKELGLLPRKGSQKPSGNPPRSTYPPCLKTYCRPLVCHRTSVPKSHKPMSAQATDSHLTIALQVTHHKVLLTGPLLPQHIRIKVQRGRPTIAKSLI